MMLTHNLLEWEKKLCDSSGKKMITTEAIATEAWNVLVI